MILGEVHDNPRHHDLQAADLAALDPSAVVFEMLTADVAARVIPSVRTHPGALEAVTRWSQSGWPPLEMYLPIFAAADDAPIYGAALTREALSPLFDPEASFEVPAGFAPYGLDTDLPEEQQALREALQATAHCDALPPDMLPTMVLAQRLRDAALAEAALEALRAEGPPVVVITGNGHARTDWGMPAAIAAAAPEVTVLSVAHLERPPEGDAPFDLWRVTEAVDRPDPCAAFTQ